MQETDVIHFDEHKKIREAVVEGPHGMETVVLSVEDDIHFDGGKKKSEKVGEGLHANKSEEGDYNSKSGPTSVSHQHQLENKA